MHQILQSSVQFRNVCSPKTEILRRRDKITWEIFYRRISRLSRRPYTLRAS